MKKKNKFIKPAQFAEHEIIKAIVNKEWLPEQNLLPERELAELLGVTRPTLREVLQRLSREGWLTIRHGKPTIVNDYEKTGGLAVLKSLVKYNEFTSITLIKDWLEFRVLMLPDLACKSISFNPNVILEKLNATPNIKMTGAEFAVFDWDLQMLMINNSGNSIAKMLYNDLAEIYNKESSVYFDNEQTKTKSTAYYLKLKKMIENNDTGIKKIIRETMQNSLDIWERINKQI